MDLKYIHKNSGRKEAGIKSGKPLPVLKMPDFYNAEIYKMVILIDKQDHPIGRMEKQEAHEKGLLHRAFSVFIFNSKGELLLQRRAFDKYHSGGLWTNTCCSHPKPGENTAEAAKTRLHHEMGITCKLNYVRKFTYRAPFDNGLTEYETDYLYIGFTDSIPHINREEVAEYKYLTPEDIRQEIKRSPEIYTAWFKLIMEKFSGEISVPQITSCV